ncbi:hypothetical protein NU08_4568 [Flavobacterium anhuiense]|uniref:Uncharacterized protein n=1 Tax=Flavobacterium anhuiense TaxID=459526 RepID=A0A444VRY9_9FLAO|nr:hypothetical protein [Flavobacterium anhuiense]RYJ36399.1 hypothetical protein NU08_4568 [Flavobacterium anhuiense]
MKYIFEKYNHFDERDNRNKSTALIAIENEEQYGEYFITEIKNLNLHYLEEIVNSLKLVLSGNLQQYNFGYEVYSIDCNKNISSIIDIFTDDKIILELPTQEIYEFIRDWKDYLTENQLIP